MSHLGRSDGPGLHAVYASQRHRIALLIDAELTKLSRRRPEFAPEDLADVRTMLWRITRPLFLQPLTRGRVAPTLAAHLLALDDAGVAGPETPKEGVD